MKKITPFVLCLSFLQCAQAAITLDYTEVRVDGSAGSISDGSLNSVITGSGVSRLVTHTVTGVDFGSGLTGTVTLAFDLTAGGGDIVVTPGGRLGIDGLGIRDSFDDPSESITFSLNSVSAAITNGSGTIDSVQFNGVTRLVFDGNNGDLDQSFYGGLDRHSITGALTGNDSDADANGHTPSLRATITTGTTGDLFTLGFSDSAGGNGFATGAQTFSVDVNASVTSVPEASSSIMLLFSSLLMLNRRKRVS